MDPRTAYHLSKIGRSIPKDLLKRGLKEDSHKDEGAMREIAEYAAKKDPKIAEMIKKGAFDPSKDVIVDQKGDAEIQKWVETKVSQEMRDGKIKPATKEDIEKGKRGEL